MSDIKCAHCKNRVGDCSGESGIYGSHHILCEPCFNDEEDLMEEVGSNDPAFSDKIAERLKGYGLPNDPHDY